MAQTDRVRLVTHRTFECLARLGHRTTAVSHGELLGIDHLRSACGDVFLVDDTTGQTHPGNYGQAPQFGHEAHCTCASHALTVEGLVANERLVIVAQQTSHDAFKPAGAQLHASAIAPEWAIRTRALHNGHVQRLIACTRSLRSGRPRRGGLAVRECVKLVQLICTSVVALRPMPDPDQLEVFSHLAGGIFMIRCSSRPAFERALRYS